jgi:hypothetical protein
MRQEQEELLKDTVLLRNSRAAQEKEKQEPFDFIYCSTSQRQKIANGVFLRIRKLRVGVVAS